MTDATRNPETAEITAEELAARLEAGDPIQVLDVRAGFRLESGKIALAPADRFFNMAGSEVMMLDDPGTIGLDRSDPVAVVCAEGVASRAVAEFLNRHGFVARSMAGGMGSWFRAVRARPVEPPAGFERLVQLDRIGKACLGYLLVSGGEAFLIDVPRDHGPFRAALEETGARLVGVADTHAHADYLSGGAALARAAGVPYYLHPADNVYPYDGTPGKLAHEPLADGQEIPVGEARLRVLHTPGHTEGSVTFLAGKEAAFTGDFVFIESLGRPDLAGKTEAWTEDLWKSLVRVKETWPAALRVYPAHYAAESERRQDRSVWRRFGELIETNEPLRIADPAAFRAWVKSHLSPPPSAYRQIKAANVGLRQVSDADAELLEFGKNECAMG